MDISSYLVLLFFPLLMAYAAFSDLFSMNISNKVSLILIIGFAFFAWQVGMTWDDVSRHVIIFLITLAIGFTIFALNLAGGGDAKLLACTALWLGSETAAYVIFSALIGGLFGLALLLVRNRMIPEKLYSIGWIKRIHQDGFGMPYGVALGIGAVMVFPSSVWMDHVIAKATG